jgi:hypothetical protein
MPHQSSDTKDETSDMIHRGPGAGTWIKQKKRLSMNDRRPYGAIRIAMAAGRPTSLLAVTFEVGNFDFHGLQFVVTLLDFD